MQIWQPLLNIITAISLLAAMPQGILFQLNMHILKSVCVITVDVVCITIVISSGITAVKLMLNREKSIN